MNTLPSHEKKTVILKKKNWLFGDLRVLVLKLSGVTLLFLSGWRKQTFLSSSLEQIRNVFVPTCPTKTETQTQSFGAAGRQYASISEKNTFPTCWVKLAAAPFTVEASDYFCSVYTSSTDKLRRGSIHLLQPSSDSFLTSHKRRPCFSSAVTSGVLYIVGCSLTYGEFRD